MLSEYLKSLQAVLHDKLVVFIRTAPVLLPRGVRPCRVNLVQREPSLCELAIFVKVYLHASMGDSLTGTR